MVRLTQLLSGGTAIALLVVACGESSRSASNNGTGGSGNAAGSADLGRGGENGGAVQSPAGSGGGGTLEAKCESFEPCGGDVVGKWKIDSICGNTSAPPDQTACSDEVVSEKASGDWRFEFSADGTVTISGDLYVTTELVTDDACAMAHQQGTAQTFCDFQQPVRPSCPQSAGGTANGGNGGTTSFNACAGMAGVPDNTTTRFVNGIEVKLNCSMLDGACSCHIVEGPISSTSNTWYVAPNALPFGSDAEYCRDGDALTLRFTSDSFDLDAYLVLVPAT